MTRVKTDESTDEEMNWRFTTERSPGRDMTEESNQSKLGYRKL